ncbi:dicarboxylate/amino acid:cation symporter [Cloacibacillus porcorum]|uniref:Sodium:dicarboxylate symporter n=1 Tax=Cloacibacillus porcorum TaxID=1197717 RepID=A0A1B2I488_9BACT|nr:dicarboxylate/amino acid:cation symporter [Cloacibacillus porcorum]ANZ44757.1 sodium:dicarboxylate symporter [Cloacibacillus porcorum]MCC8185029.1 dicarboxylate/amino acid:cation symporter [Cloacibacillus porcorum]MDD7649540.1 dicarboxylate/amino acid:cation symporter [Cloacibacillus porcorum]MDY4093957.1 dicarboxylate/amino acid:cation symporter [Cloacibacillus porcorum]MDY5388778.1 dicarboxylate/amino acid:cation symporter [Cloacibacillus porcorum]
MQEKKKLSLIAKIGVGFIIGLILGFIIGPMAPNSPFIADIVIPLLQLVGNIFLALLKMLIVPLVFSSLIMGASSIGDPKVLGRIGVKTVAFYLGTTVVAIAIGLVLGNIIQPGVGMAIEGAKAAAKEPETVFNVILNIFPANPLKALVEGVMLQVIVFALFLGVAATLIGEKGRAFLEFNSSLAEVMFKVTAIVMKTAPYGIFALIAVTAAKYGPAVLAPFAKVIFAVYLGCFLQVVIVYSGLITGIVHKSPLWFLRGVREAMLAAFVTRTSAGVLPISMNNVQNNLGVSEDVSAFVLPLGATINMDGTAIYEGICALFVAQAFGIDLSFGAQLGILMTATLASIGTAGVPGAGLIMLSMVLVSAGLPIEGMALVAGIDAVLDMARTCVNVTGDMCVSTVIAKTEGEKL